MEETQAQITAQIVAAAVREAAQATAQAVRETATAAATVKENESDNAMTAIAILQTKMTAIEKQQVSFETEIGKRMDKFDATFTEMFKQLSDIAKGRPPWAVTAIISLLTTACGILATYAAFK